MMRMLWSVLTVIFLETASAPEANAYDALGTTVRLRGACLALVGGQSATTNGSARLVGGALVPTGELAASESGTTLAGGAIFGLVGAADDADRDRLGDAQDNCSTRSNVTQIDSDADGFGNACDPDYNNDGVVGLPDFNRFRSLFGITSESPRFEPALDHNGDGVVGIPDFNVLRLYFGKQPGPSGLLQ